LDAGVLSSELTGRLLSAVNLKSAQLSKPFRNPGRV